MDASPSALPNGILDCVSEMLADLNNRLSEEIRQIQFHHQDKFAQVLISIRESVKNEVSQELLEGLETRFQSSMATIQQQFKEKLEAAQTESAKEKDQLEKEIEGSRRQTEAVAAELSSKEAELGQLDREAREMLEDPDVEISKMIRHNAIRNEVKMYIKGLRFLATETKEK